MSTTATIRSQHVFEQPTQQQAHMNKDKPLHQSSNIVSQLKTHITSLQDIRKIIKVTRSQSRTDYQSQSVKK